ncbi:hypothetical protein [Streptomyces sp. A5-4]|uniref:hypothetical protein n=1 Tax=Streptomyces sp. A5-4 TaxID=3384771 RepID=UPI003DA893CA
MSYGASPAPRRAPSTRAEVLALTLLRGTGTTRPLSGTEARPGATADVNAGPVAAAGSPAAV